jgi:hypothetical protein
VGIGTYTSSGNTLSRDTVLSSSNAGSLVSFAAGLKDVICTQPSERAVYLDSATNATIPGLTLSGGTASTALALNASKQVVSVTNTGTGDNVLATSPTLITPALGTPSSGVVTNLTGTASININGTVGATTPASGSFTSLTDSGNLAFTGTGNRITGDFSNATVANRVAFQTSTVNGNTSIECMPNGTATIAALALHATSDIANSSVLQLRAENNNDIRISAANRGTGTLLPMTFFTGNSERVRIDTSGNVGIGTSSPDSPFQVSGQAKFGLLANPVRINSSAATGIIEFSSTSNIIRTLGATPLIFQTDSGTERMRIDSSGNVGIGTSSPAAKLTVAGSAVPNITSVSTGGISTSLSSVDVFGGGYLGTASNHPQMFYTNNTERMRIDSSGNVGIGVSAPNSKLDVVDTNCIVFSRGSAGFGSFYAVGSGTNPAYLFLGNAGGEKGRITSDDGGTLIFSNTTSSTERMRIDSSGNLLVGKTSTSASATGVVIAGSGSADHGQIDIARPPNAGMLRIINSDSGSIVGTISQNGTNTTYATSSDYRLKHDIQPMTGALAKVAALKPVTYKWNVDDHQSQGFIAHELQEVVPECVTGEKDAVDADGKPKYQGIDTSFLVATLAAAIQELKAELDTVKAELATLKGTQP